MTTLRDAGIELPALPADNGPSQVTIDVSGRKLAILVDHDRVVGIQANDERAAESARPLPPLVILPAAMGLADFVSSPAVTLLELDVPGALLVDDHGTPVALLPVEVIGDYLAGPEYLAPARQLGPHGPVSDATWPAASRAAPIARLVCAAEGCGAVNEIIEYSADPPLICSNTTIARHPLMLRLG